MEKQRSRNLICKNSIRNLFTANKDSWIKSFASGLSQDKNGNFLPWMTYEAIDYIKKNLSATHTIFEFGCGTSTIFYANHAKSVISLETNKKWFELITKKIAKLNSSQSSFKFEKSPISLVDNIFIKNNVMIMLLENGQLNDNYTKILSFFNQKFDWIIIDSLKRYECSLMAIKNICNNGTIILDDSQRSSYKKIYDFFVENHYKYQEFWGIAPGQIKIKNTTFFAK